MVDLTIIAAFMMSASAPLFLASGVGSTDLKLDDSVKSEMAGKQPVPAANPGDWVTSADYPKWALYSGVEGVVKFALTVNASGSVDHCEILESSKVPDLDNAACQSVAARGRFLPARNAKGEAVQGVWKSSVRWQVPVEQPAPVNGLMESGYVVDRDGNITDCRTTRAEGSLASTAKVGVVDCPDRSFIPPVDSKGNAVRKKVMFRMVVEVVDLPN